MWSRKTTIYIYIYIVNKNKCHSETVFKKSRVQWCKTAKICCIAKHQYQDQLASIQCLVGNKYYIFFYPYIFFLLISGSMDLMLSPLRGFPPLRPLRFWPQLPHLVWLLWRYRLISLVGDTRGWWTCNVTRLEVGGWNPGNLRFQQGGWKGFQRVTW